MGNPTARPQSHLDQAIVDPGSIHAGGARHSRDVPAGLN
jgi:hypothetical protein